MVADNLKAEFERDSRQAQGDSRYFCWPQGMFVENDNIWIES